MSPYTLVSRLNMTVKYKFRGKLLWPCVDEGAFDPYWQVCKLGSMCSSLPLHSHLGR